MEYLRARVCVYLYSCMNEAAAGRGHFYSSFTRRRRADVSVKSHARAFRRCFFFILPPRMWNTIYIYV